jgi:hypothetical protein
MYIDKAVSRLPEGEKSVCVVTFGFFYNPNWGRIVYLGLDRRCNVPNGARILYRGRSPSPTADPPPAQTGAEPMCRSHEPAAGVLGEFGVRD